MSEAEYTLPVKRETGASPVRTRHCKQGVFGHVPLVSREGAGNGELQVRRPAWGKAQEARASGPRVTGRAETQGVFCMSFTSVKGLFILSETPASLYSYAFLMHPEAAASDGRSPEIRRICRLLLFCVWCCLQQGGGRAKDGEAELYKAGKIF